jgi:hypothetical protein
MATSTRSFRLERTRSYHAPSLPTPPASIAMRASSVATLFATRMEPCDAALPSDSGSLVPWMERGASYTSCARPSGLCGAPFQGFGAPGKQGACAVRFPPLRPDRETPYTPVDPTYEGVQRLPADMRRRGR